MDTRATDFWSSPDLAVQIGGDAPTRQDRPDAAMDWAFGLATPELRLFTTGVQRRLPSGPAATLGERARRFFSEYPAAGGLEVSPRLLVGAIPFDREDGDCLFLPERAANRAWSPPFHQTSSPRSTRITAEPSRAAYQDAVGKALVSIRASREGAQPVDKVVLSRSLRLEADASFDAFALWRDLQADPSAARFLVPLGPGRGGAMRRLVGASPELLISRRGGGDPVASSGWFRPAQSRLI